MIKFFRQIRKSLLEQNKMGKYFKYAIGEIILVIIGILFALQINNWNENRKSAIKTNTYLKALHTEIETNISALKGHIKTTHNDIAESANMRKLLNVPEAKHYNDSIVKYILITRPIYKATLAKSTFDDLINAGVLENLDDSQLKNEILSITLHIENVYEKYKDASDAWVNYQLPYHMKYTTVTNNWDTISGIKIDKLSFKRKKEAFVYNFDYANILALRMKMMNNYENALINTKEKFVALSNRIEVYLKENDYD